MRTAASCLALLVGTLWLTLEARADINVVSTNPAINALAVNRQAAVHVTFDSDIDGDALTGRQFYLFGQWSGVAAGRIETSEDRRTITFVPDHPFSAGERVTVYVARSLAATDGSTLGRGYAFQFWVASAPAGMDLIVTDRVTVRGDGERWLQTYGAYAADFNEDGYSDLVVPNERTNDIRLFLNDGAGGYDTFDVYPLSEGAAPSTNEAADFNLDGHVDFAVGNSQGRHINVFFGDGTGKLVAADAPEADDGIRGLAVIDLNGDGYPDLTTANRAAGTISMLVNDGNGAFPIAESINTPALGETAASAADMNEDGLLDMVVGALESGDVHVLLADGQGSLLQHSQTTAGPGVWMVVTGDVNGDGHADVATANSGGNSVSILLGDGTGSLTLSSTYSSPLFPLAIDLGDLDGDGDLDMVSSTFRGGPDGLPGTWRVYENLGNGTFEPAGVYPATAAGSCAVLHDRNNDGALDMSTIDELEDELVLFTNQLVSTSVRDEQPITLPLVSFAPNPFFEETTIDVQTVSDHRARIDVYDMTGRLVRRFDQPESNGTSWKVHWDGRNDQGSAVAAGAYLVRADTGAGVDTQILIRAIN